MRKKYETPEIDVLKLRLKGELLGPSTSTFEPEDPIGEDVSDIE